MARSSRGWQRVDVIRETDSTRVPSGASRPTGGQSESGGRPAYNALMGRVVHVRVHGLDPSRRDSLRARLAELAASRDWRGDVPWLADAQSTALFEMEYFRHAAMADTWEAPDLPPLSAGGFVRVAGDETDALALLFAARDLSERFAVTVTIRDPDNPIAKLRDIRLESGRLPDGAPLEAILVARPINKRMPGAVIEMYPPRALGSAFGTLEGRDRERRDWGFRVPGLRASRPGSDDPRRVPARPAGGRPGGQPVHPVRRRLAGAPPVVHRGRTRRTGSSAVRRLLRGAADRRDRGRRWPLRCPHASRCGERWTGDRGAQQRRAALARRRGIAAGPGLRRPAGAEPGQLLLLPPAAAVAEQLRRASAGAGRGAKAGDAQPQRSDLSVGHGPQDSAVTQLLDTAAEGPLAALGAAVKSDVKPQQVVPGEDVADQRGSAGHVLGLRAEPLEGDPERPL